MLAPFREWTGGPLHRHGPLSRAQHLRTSASYRWWYLVYLHRTVLTTLGIALRRSFAPAPQWLPSVVVSWHVVHNAVRLTTFFFSLGGLLVRLLV